MGKKRSWFSLVKRLILSEAKPKAEKKSKRWRWVFGRLKLKHCPALSAPERTVSEAREEQRKHALAVAIAATVAAEAAFAAAHAAAEVVRLAGVPQSYLEYENMTQNLAAIKIQSAYRAHLARKALRALKGLVRLQAIIRGQIVRGQVITKLKCLPSIAKTESQVHQLRVPNVDESCKDGEEKEKDIKLERNSQRNWDYSLFSKEEMETLLCRKQEAIIKRERMKRYIFSHRNLQANCLLQERRNDQTLQESTSNEQWADGEAYKSRDTEKLKSSVLHSNLIDGDTHRAQLKLRNAYKHDSAQDLNSSLVTLPRRSFCHAKQRSIGDESSLPNSPVFPTFMAVTESVKAKARSISMPKQRLGFLDTSNSDHSSPYKLRLSSWSSFNGEGTSTDGQSTDTSQQISIPIKGLYGD